MADIKTYIDTKAAQAGGTQSGFTAIAIGARQTVKGGNKVQVPISSAFVTLYWYSPDASEYILTYRKTQNTINNSNVDLILR